MSVIADSEDFWDELTVRKFFGGASRPIHRSTLHRGVKNGAYPPPFKAGAKQANRWIPDECRRARDAMLAARGDKKAAGEPSTA